MSSPKLLNLDDFATAQKVVTIDGVQHEMRELTVQEFIDKAAEARKNQTATESLTIDQQTDKAIEMVTDAFPTIPVERLRKLKLSQLTVLLDFMFKAPEQIEAEAKAAQGNA